MGRGRGGGGGGFGGAPPPGFRPRQTGFRVLVKNLPMSASWQDVKVGAGGPGGRGQGAGAGAPTCFARAACEVLGAGALQLQRTAGRAPCCTVWSAHPHPSPLPPSCAVSSCLLRRTSSARCASPPTQTCSATATVRRKLYMLRQQAAYWSAARGRGRAPAAMRAPACACACGDAGWGAAWCAPAHCCAAGGQAQRAPLDLPARTCLPLGCRPGGCGGV